MNKDFMRFGSGLILSALTALLAPSAMAAGFYLAEVGSPASLGTAGVANPTNTFHADAAWTNPHEVKDRYPKASIIGNNRVIFDICGGSYRLIVHIKYGFQTVIIRFIGTHAEYDRINAEEI